MKKSPLQVGSANYFFWLTTFFAYHEKPVTAEVILANPLSNQLVEPEPFSFNVSQIFDYDSSDNFFLTLAPKGASEEVPQFVSIAHEQVGAYSFVNSQSYDIHKKGEIAFVLTAEDPIGVRGQQGLCAFNVSDITDPTLLDCYPISIAAVDFLLYQNYAVLAAIDSLIIFDVSDPTSIQKITEYDAVGSQGVDIDESRNLLFVARGNRHVSIYNISDPYVSQEPLATWSGGGAHCSVKVDGDILYCYICNNGLFALNIADPENPQVVGSLTPFPREGGSYSGMDIADNVLFLPRTPGLSAISIVDPHDLQLLSTYPISHPRKVHLSHSIAYISHEVGYTLLDVTDPRGMKYITTNTEAEEVRSMDVEEPYVFAATGHVASSHAVLKIFDLRQGTIQGAPKVLDVGKYSLLLQANLKSGDTITTTLTITVDRKPIVLNNLPDLSMLPQKTLKKDIVVDSYFEDLDGMQLIWSNAQTDLSQFDWQVKPILVNQVALRSGCVISDIAVTLPYAYFACSATGIESYDISTPHAPSPVWSFTQGATAFLKLAITQDKLYATSASQSYTVIFDITNHSAPVLVWSQREQGALSGGVSVFNDLAVTGNFVSRHVQIFNISDNTFQEISTINTQSPVTGVALQGSTLVVSGITKTIILDMTTPDEPVVTWTSNQSSTCVMVEDAIAYLCLEEGTLQLLNIVDKTNPFSVGEYPILANSITVEPPFLFVTSPEREMHILDTSALPKISLFGSYFSSAILNKAVAYGRHVFTGGSDGSLYVLDMTQRYELQAVAHADEVGNHEVDVFMQDELGGDASQTFTLRVEGSPQVNFPLPAQLAIVGQPFDYFIAQGTFSDPNFDPIEITARGQNGSLSWWNFDGVSQVTGLPRTVDVGSETVTFELTDHHPQLPKTSTTLTLVVEEYLPPQDLVSGRHFEYVLPSFVFSQVGNVTQLSAQQMDGELLPGWMVFDEHAAKFYGDPPSHHFGSLFTELKATNALGDEFRRPFQLVFSVNQPPYVQNQISNQVANVGDEFRFPLSDTIFLDANGDELTYFAKEEGEETLPTWLYFDGRLFSGQPERSDMNFFSGKRYAIEVTASDGYQNATVVFNADVKGTSNGELLLKVASPILTVLGLGLTAYRKRKYILNRVNREKYQLPAVRIEVGKPCVIPLQTSADVGNSIQLKFKKPQQSRWCGLFGSKHVSLFDGALPYWLHYDISSGELRSECVPDNPFPEGGQPMIQVKNKQGVIQEQFVIEVVYPENQSVLDVAGDNTNIGSNPPSLPPPLPEPGGGVEMPRL